MICIDDFIAHFSDFFPAQVFMEPWDLVKALPEILSEKLKTLSDDFIINGNIAIHKSAQLEDGVTLKGPAIICEGCFIAAHAYIRGGVFLSKSVTIGPGCEVKSSIIFEKSSIAHFNFLGDSMIGSNVNFEAGAVIANHYNERLNKRIFVKHNEDRIDTGCDKFGALVGDGSRIGANAVLCPGTILPMHSVVKRLQLIEQV